MPWKEIFLSFLGSFRFLNLSILFDLLSSHFFHSFLLYPQFSIWLYLLFCFNCFLFCSHLIQIFILIDFYIIIFLQIQMKFCHFSLHRHLFLNSLLLVFKHLYVSSSLWNYITCSFTRFIYFANSLNNYLEKITFPSSYFNRPILLQSNLRSSSALLRAILAATSFRCRVASSSSSYGVKSNSFNC